MSTIEKYPSGNKDQQHAKNNPEFTSDEIPGAEVIATVCIGWGGGRLLAKTNTA
ncbi:MAG: hypothetical protein JAY90_01100 [Candidatus Thiodiazotropha lotti]|nr:hypothetical protein [Candidatus Thiodiazotropha lotti]